MSCISFENLTAEDLVKQITEALAEDASVCIQGTNLAKSLHLKNDAEEEAEEEAFHSEHLSVLGIVLLLVMLYRLLHSRRAEIREISWRILSSTISIFAGVCMYNSVCQPLLRLLISVCFEDSHEGLDLIWAFFFYVVFVISISGKALLGFTGNGVSTRLAIIEDQDLTETVGDRLRDKLYNAMAHVPTDKGTVSHRYRRIRRQTSDAMQVILAGESKFVQGGRERYMEIVCALIGESFWAHAIGFACIDDWKKLQHYKCCTNGWSEDEEYECENKPFHDQIRWSVLLILKQVGMFYLLLYAMGVIWKFSILKLVNPACYHIAKCSHEGDDDADGAQERYDKEGKWKPWRRSMEEEELEDFQEFTLKKVFSDGKHTFVSEHGFQWKDSVGETRFDTCKWWQWSYRAGEFRDAYGKISYCYAIPVYDELVELFCETRADGENDVAALSISFLLVQTVRLCISGNLSNEGQEDLTKHERTDGLKIFAFAVACIYIAFHAQAFMVGTDRQPLRWSSKTNRRLWKRLIWCIQYCASLFLFLCVFVFVYLSTCSELDDVSPLSRTSVACACLSVFLFVMCRALHSVLPRTDTELRMFDISINILLLSASWCMMFDLEWFLAPHLVFGSDNTILISIAGTAIVFSLIWMLDLLLIFDDRTHGRQKSEYRMRRTGTFELSKQGAYKKINTTIGLLIGFVWEAEFDYAVEDLSNSVTPGPWKWRQTAVKVSCGLILLFFALPVWYNNIIPMCQEHGYFFGFVFRRLYARLDGIQSELLAADQENDYDTYSRMQSFLGEHKAHLSEIAKIFTTFHRYAKEKEGEEEAEDDREHGGEDEHDDSDEHDRDGERESKDDRHELRATMQGLSPIKEESPRKDEEFPKSTADYCVRQDKLKSDFSTFKEEPPTRVERVHVASSPSTTRCLSEKVKPVDLSADRSDSRRYTIDLESLAVRLCSRSSSNDITGGLNDQSSPFKVVL